MDLVLELAVSIPSWNVAGDPSFDFKNAQTPIGIDLLCEITTLRGVQADIFIWSPILIYTVLREQTFNACLNLTSNARICE